MDEFVQAVLETKAALVRSVVEGEALAGDGGGAVLEELERAVAAMSPGLADAGLDSKTRTSSTNWCGQRPNSGATRTP
jgi:hypothetical protein